MSGSTENPVRLNVSSKLRCVLSRGLATLGLTSLMLSASLHSQTPPLPTPQTSVHVRDSSLDEYRQHLSQLQTLLQACSLARDAKSCDPAAAGPDDRVPVTNGSRTESRIFRYDWLRSAFARAGIPAEGSKKPDDQAKTGKQVLGVGDGELPVPELLKAAEARLKHDLAQSSSPVAPAPDHGREREVMRQVLAGPEFRGLQQQTVKNSFLEKLAQWLNHLFASAAALKARSAWIGRAIVWGFIVAVCVALIYGLLRLERRWRVRLTPVDSELPAPGAASARDWQLWLEDARRAAASGQWREAIHFLYWAAISRLESRRLWPADRARTPREYLALLAPEDPRWPSLSQLTHTFERFWYGGRTAVERDYTAAESLANSLISGNASGAARSEGGGQ